jgi:threonine 3-dehydrogenase
VHTAFAADVTAKKVLVTGCGPVGVMSILVVKAAGARAIYATDLSDYRLEMACRAGATLTVNPARQDVVQAIRAATEGEGVDVLLEMSGAPAAIAQGFTLLKPGGEAALLGVAPGPVTFDYNLNVVFKGAKVYGITGRKLWETWYQARGLVRSGAVDLAPVVTHRFRLEEYDQAFEAMASGESGKVVLFP